MIGSTLLDRYKIESELGRGGMGIVYRAQDTLLSRAVAIKFLNTEGVDLVGKAHLLQEARAAAQLNHPNIVSIYDVDEIGGNPFIVMELVKGITLRKSETPTLSEALNMAYQICLALDHAHGKGIIHRDLKLENIVVTNGLTLKLMDFGLARTADDTRLLDSALVGTLAYIAPELIQGEESSAQSDLYAFGIILYELLTGQAPFRGTINAVLAQHVQGKVTPPSLHNPDIPAWLDDVILSLLNKRPEERPASAKHVLQILDAMERQRESQEAELTILQKAVAHKYSRLYQLINSTVPAGDNPYLFLQPFGLSDHIRFFGREELLADLIQHMSDNPITFLCGIHGAGKTSLIKAGLLPSLLRQGHLPIMITTTSERLEISIKKDLIPDLDSFQFLKAMSVTTFIDNVTASIPDEKMLYILVDDFDLFFEHEETARNAFYMEWLRCFNRESSNVHWLFAIPSELHHLLNLFKGEIHPNSHTINIPILDREAARFAIIKPAEAYRVHIHEEVITSILDTLGGENIHPAELQLVCYMLAGKRGASVKEWDAEHYIKLGKADGILRDYLEFAIEELEPQIREPAWEIMAVLANPDSKSLTDEQLVENMKLHGVSEHMTRRILTELQSCHLIKHAAAYRLSSDSLRPRIEKWQETHSVLVKARQEAQRQLQSIRNSALRGMVGGALGFALVEQLLLNKSFSLSLEVFDLMLVISIGALAGLLIMFSIDVAIASYTGPKKPLAYLAGGISGAFSFALTMVLYTNLNSIGDEQFLFLIPKAILEGGLWGLVAGAGLTWSLSSRRPIWITSPLVLILCWLTLFETDAAFGILAKSSGLNNATPLTVAVSGMIFPGFILVAALTGQRPIY